MRERKWIVHPVEEPTAELRGAVGGHPLVARLLHQRGFQTPETARTFLDPGAYVPASPGALVGLERAAALLKRALEREERILVWGDFDVDGQTSTSLLVAGLLGLSQPGQVRYHVPNRFSEGHGIRPWKLKEYLDDPAWRPDLLLTCDTGISDGPGIGLAKEAGLTVIVTDHHDLPAELGDVVLGQEPEWGLSPEEAGPEGVRRADAVVNPKFQTVGDPLRTLPGVGVAYKLIERLFELCGRAGEASEYLDLVALGIVADVAEQVHDARYLLQIGLERLRRTRRVGLLALMENARLTPEHVDAESIGFQLGPRMNALGRLEDATVAVDLLTTDDPIRAGELAARMERLNNDRRLLTSQITKMAFDILDRQPQLLDFNAIVLAHPNWHAGIVGIVASRLVEEFDKPTVLLLNPPGETARGSARSVPGVDIGASIAACDSLLLGHGGHPGAAGLTLEADRIDAFRRELSRQIDQHRIDDAPQGLAIDAELPFAELSMHLVEEIERLAPFGNGNPQPLFMSRHLVVEEDRRIGREGTHRRLMLRDRDGNRQPIVWWRGADVSLPEGPLDLAYHIGINQYRGERTLQITYRDSRPYRDAPIEVELAPSVQEYAETYESPIRDLRRESFVQSLLPDPGESFWFAEGTQLDDVALNTRLMAGDAPRGRPLVVWSAPPAPELLRWLVETVEPDGIYLVGRECGDDRLKSVLKSVAGMVKFALARDCLLPIDRLAARIGSTEAIIRYSLLWLEVEGLVKLIEWEEGDTVRISPGVQERRGTSEEKEILQAELQELIAEVRAYRRFFRRASVGSLNLL